ncbi:MAG: Uma2 family endonuclease [Gemmataceae bacterium]
MSTVPQSRPPGAWWLPPEKRPNIDHIVIDDGAPVDGMYSERQMRLLAEPLHTSWPGPGEGRSFLALVNVGMFFDVNKPPLVPDMMLSLDVAAGDPRKKENNSYFYWVMGKPPDAVVEIVSNREGGELTSKLKAYPKRDVPYYIVWDPLRYLSDQPLQCFVNVNRKYKPCEPWFSEIGLGLTVWRGVYEGMKGDWLRWVDAEGELIPTGGERAEQERQRAEEEAQRAEEEKERAAEAKSQARRERRRADQEKARAEEEKARADQHKSQAERAKARADALAAKLRALEVDPDKNGA